MRGRVTDATGRPAVGAAVRLYNQDLALEDRLGAARTDTDGAYRLAYPAARFEDLFARRPGLYVWVLDAAGETLHATSTGLVPRTGRDAVLDVQLPESQGGQKP